MHEGVSEMEHGCGFVGVGGKGEVVILDWVGVRGGVEGGGSSRRMRRARVLCASQGKASKALRSCARTSASIPISARGSPCAT